MKIALYIEDGFEQIVLTPQTDTEKGLLEKLHSSDIQTNIRRGSFYACQGGFVRQREDGRESTMICLNRPPEEQE